MNPQKIISIFARHKSTWKSIQAKDVKVGMVISKQLNTTPILVKSVSVKKSFLNNDLELVHIDGLIYFENEVSLSYAKEHYLDVLIDRKTKEPIMERTY